MVLGKSQPHRFTYIENRLSTPNIHVEFVYKSLIDKKPLLAHCTHQIFQFSLGFSPLSFLGRGEYDRYRPFSSIVTIMDPICDVRTSILNMARYLAIIFGITFKQCKENYQHTLRGFQGYVYKMQMSLFDRLFKGKLDFLP